MDVPLDGSTNHRINSHLSGYPNKICIMCAHITIAKGLCIKTDFITFPLKNQICRLKHRNISSVNNCQIFILNPSLAVIPTILFLAEGIRHTDGCIFIYEYNIVVLGEKQLCRLFWLPAWWALWLLWWPLTDAAMFQCVYGYLQSVFVFLVLVHCCILLEIKLTTTTTTVQSTSSLMFSLNTHTYIVSLLTPIDFGLDWAILTLLWPKPCL